MKTKIFSLFLLSFLASAFSPLAANIDTDPVDVKVVVSAKKIWFITDETPVKCLCVKVKDSHDKVVLEKCLNSKTADWSLNVESLPKGEYTVMLGQEKSVKFKR